MSKGVSRDKRYQGLSKGASWCQGCECEKVSLVSMGVRSVRGVKGCHGSHAMARGVRDFNGIKGCHGCQIVTGCDMVSGV